VRTTAAWTVAEDQLHGLKTGGAARPRPSGCSTARAACTPETAAIAGRLTPRRGSQGSGSVPCLGVLWLRSAFDRPKRSRSSARSWESRFSSEQLLPRDATSRSVKPLTSATRVRLCCSECGVLGDEPLEDVRGEVEFEVAELLGLEADVVNAQGMKLTYAHQPSSGPVSAGQKPLCYPPSRRIGRAA
jgi:hypothetical protein